MNKQLINFTIATAAVVMTQSVVAASQPSVQVASDTAIGEINISGNRSLATEQIKQFLRAMDIVKGNPVNPEALQKAQQELQKQYINQGNNASTVDFSLRPLTNNRAAVDIKINEGGISRIQKIDIIGNQAFSDEVLLAQLQSGTRPALSFFSDKDKFSREKMLGDFDRLASFYRDRGYLKFDILDNNIALTPDKRGVNVTLKISEGAQYRVGNVAVEGLNLSHNQLNSLVLLRKGQVFSQKNLEQTRKNLADILGKQGFAFSKIAPVPDINEATHEVGIRFVVESGKRTYVRRINVRGNNRTKDAVYRREIRQLESSPFSQQKMEQSRERLERLPYVEDVAINMEPVAGTPDQVDMTVVVKERSANQFRVGAGYSQSNGILFNVGLAQQNFMGTGNELNVDLDNSSVNKNFNVNYNNPYYTPGGIGRGFGVFYNKYNAEAANISSYVSNRFGADMRFSVPVSENSAFNIKVGAERREIVLGDTPADHITTFVADHGTKYRQFPTTLSYAYDTRNRSVFPTKGQRHRLSLATALPNSSLEYYKFGYDGAAYYPVTDTVTASLKANVGVGKGGKGLDGLPFFEKYVAGGVGSVRGFDTNSLGPKDSNGNSMGGDAVVTGTAEVQFPVPFASDVKNLKMGAFIDVGNVYDKSSDFSTKSLRASAGVGVTWISPFGPLEVSWSKPIKKEEGDDLKAFQFSLGTSF